VLKAEGAATNSIGFIIALFVTSSKGKSVNEMESRRPLSNSHLLVLEFFSVLFSNAVDVVLWHSITVSRTEKQ
jgi:hypothetical protein